MEEYNKPRTKIDMFSPFFVIDSIFSITVSGRENSITKYLLQHLRKKLNPEP